MEKIISRVLILVVMEDGLVLRELLLWISAILVLILVVMEDGLVLSATEQPMPGDPMVLILVVMEDGLVHIIFVGNYSIVGVLILVVMEDGLVQFYVEPFKILEYGLNPCCNGRWSRTSLFLYY